MNFIPSDKTNKESSDAEKTPDVPKQLPPNPQPPGQMRVIPPQVRIIQSIHLAGSHLFSNQFTGSNRLCFHDACLWFCSIAQTKVHSVLKDLSKEIKYRSA